MSIAPTSVLITGPSGSGKTYLIQSLCATYGLRVYDVGCSTLAIAFPGEFHVGLAHTFRKARLSGQNCVVLLEHADVEFPSSGERDVQLFTLLRLMEGSETVNNVLFVATAREATKMDTMLRQSFQHEFQLTVPSRMERKELFAHFGTSVPHEPLDMDTLHALAESCHGFLPADMVACWTTAHSMALTSPSCYTGDMGCRWTSLGVLGRLGTSVPKDQEHIQSLGRVWRMAAHQHSQMA
jgi:SpoVK/Ycf46/Vps4 family AAA+-type ATPase